MFLNQQSKILIMIPELMLIISLIIIAGFEFSNSSKMCPIFLFRNGRKMFPQQLFVNRKHHWEFHNYNFIMN